MCVWVGGSGIHIYAHMPLTQLAANMREDEMTSAVPIDIKRPDADAVPPGPIFHSPGTDFQ
jgi:hypothetical protein